MVLGGQDCAKSDKLKLHTMKVITPEINFGTVRVTVPKFELIPTHSFFYLRNLVHKNKTVGRNRGLTIYS